jgi:hypothetical protein
VGWQLTAGEDVARVVREYTDKYTSKLTVQVVAAAEDADTASALRSITHRLTGDHILVRVHAAAPCEPCLLLLKCSPLPRLARSPRVGGGGRRLLSLHPTLLALRALLSLSLALRALLSLSLSHPARW